jgi:hypothetical protein
MWRRGKPAREPRGVLLVPVLSEAGSEQPDDPAATIDESTGNVAPAVQPEPSAAPAAPPVTPPATTRAGGRFGRIAGFVALLVGLAFVGMLVGRFARNVGESGPAATAVTLAVSTATATHTTPAPRGERWGPLRATAAGRLSSPATRAAAVMAGQSVVVLGGSASNAVQVGSAGGPLRGIATLPSRRAGAAALAKGATVYLIGGEDEAGTPTDEILRFDVASQQLTTAGHFIEPLAGAGYVQSGGSLLLVGGWTGEKYGTAVLRFTDPAAAATVVARLPEGLRDPAVALVGGKLYVAGGRTAAGPSNAVYVVAPGSGTVSLLGRLPRAVAGAALVEAGGQLYLLGGRGAAGPVGTVVHIDPSTGRIEAAGSMPRPLAGAAAVRLGTATLVIGGTRPTAITRLDAG